MKNLFLLAFALCACELTLAQTNIFPATGNAGIGTTSPGVPLDINHSSASIRLQGVSSASTIMDIQIKRTNSGDQLFRSPNIGFVDAATGGAAYIQSYQGNLQFWPSGVKAVTMTSGGLVGVNTATPVSTFQVNGNGTKLSIGSANTTGLLGTSYVGFNVARRSSDNNWLFDYNTTGAGSGGTLMYGDVAGNLNVATVPTLNGMASFFLTDAQIKTYVAFQVTSGGITRAKRIKVETTGWPDFVFDREYKLPSLSSVNAYIQKNHHLPDMPSAKEVHADGQDLGEMNKLLLKKVEELTLYLIEKDEQINRLKTDQQKQITQQQTELQEFKKQLSVLMLQYKTTTVPAN